MTAKYKIRSRLSAGLSVILIFFVLSKIAIAEVNSAGPKVKPSHLQSSGTGENSEQEQTRSEGSPAEHGCERLYDSDPNHLWNRVYVALFIRRTPEGKFWGCDTSDPIFWRDSIYLFEGKAYKEAIARLDEFLESHGERLFNDPMKKALLQRDLLQLFAAMTDPGNDQFKETSHSKERTSLQRRLAAAIRRLGLSEVERSHLPSNFTAAIKAKSLPDAFDPKHPDRPFLPSKLFDPAGPWALLEADGRSLASTHNRDYNGRSNFSIYVNFPAGKTALESYLKKVNSGNEAEPVPPETQFAIVRKAILVDSEGHPYVSPIVEFLRTTVHNNNKEEQQLANGMSAPAGTPFFHEVALSRARLLAGKSGGLRGVSPEEYSFPFLVLNSYGIDQLSDKSHQEKARSRGPNDFSFGPYGSSKQRCNSCHSSRIPTALDSGRAGRSPVSVQPNRDEETVDLNRYSWGVLKTLMEAHP